MSSDSSTFFDVCIVGSGFAGVAVAQRLVGVGARVAIVEAGRAEFDPLAPAGSTHLLPTTSSGDADFGVDDNRAIVAGGGSNRWNGVATRLEPEVIAEWPIEASELAPYLDLAETWLHVHGSPVVPGNEPPRSGRFIAEFPESPLLKHPALEGGGFVRVPMAIRRGAPVRLIQDEFPALVENPLCTLLIEHVATRIFERADGAHVECHTAAGKRMVAARHLVVAAGVVDSVRLLLSSVTDRNPDGFGNHSGWLGVGVNAHPRLRRAIERHPDLEEVTTLVRSYRTARQLFEQGLNGAVLDVNYLGAIPQVDVTVEQRSRMSNLVRLQPATSSQVAARAAHVHTSLDEVDRATLAAASKILSSQARRLPGGQDPKMEEWRWFHPAGGCRMSADPANGVVDRNLTVHGSRCVHIVGASTFPRAGASNPTVTVVALALRLGDHLAKQMADEATNE